MQIPFTRLSSPLLHYPCTITSPYIQTSFFYNANLSGRPRTSARSLRTSASTIMTRNKGSGRVESSSTSLSSSRLQPRQLSAKLKHLCTRNRFEEAIFSLQTAPASAQNAPVWNTLIWECMKGKRFQLGFRLYNDMKRRGHDPTIRTFQTLLNGLSKIHDWAAHTKQLNNAQSVYMAYQRYMKTLSQESAESEDLALATAPLAAYLRILGNAGLQQEMLDVYFSLDQDGPFPPDHMVYTALFQSLISRSPLGGTAAVKNASRARQLWNLMLKASKKNGFPIDSFIVTPAISALSAGTSEDQNVAFRIVEQYFGLYGRNQSSSLPSQETDIIPLHGNSLATVLNLCIASRRYSDSGHILQQVIRRGDVGGIIDRNHIELVLNAYGKSDDPESSRKSLNLIRWMLRQEQVGVNGPKIRPMGSTFQAALATCLQTADWATAVALFELMTGYEVQDFLTSDKHIQAHARKTQSRAIVPTAEMISLMLRISLVDGNKDTVRQCLRLTWRTSKEIPFQAVVRRMQAPDKTRLITALIDAVKSVVPLEPSSTEERNWKQLARELSTALKTKNVVTRKESTNSTTLHKLSIP